MKEMKDNFEKLKTESYEKSEQIAGCKNMVSIFYVTSFYAIMVCISYEYT